MFNNVGGQKKLDEIKAAKEKIQQQAQEQTTDAESATYGMGVGSAGEEDEQELDRMDGYDNSIANNIIVRKNQIEQLRQRLQMIEAENH